MDTFPRLEEIGPSFDLSKLPYSRRGSWLAVTRDNDGSTFRLRNCRKLFGEEKLLSIQFHSQNAQPLIPEVHTTPAGIQLRFENGKGTMVICGQETLSAHVYNQPVFIVSEGGWVFPAGTDSYRIHTITNHSHTTEIRVHQGSIRTQAGVQLVDGYHQPDKASFQLEPDREGQLHFEIRCTVYESSWDVAPIDAEAQSQAACRDWKAFQAGFMMVPPRYSNAAAWMAYNLWSCLVPATGNFHYEAMLMSKNGMCAVWSWDHCFNALALLMAGHTRMALEQFFLIFECQSPEGKLPDLINSEIEWRACVKPPVHGWCFGLMMDHMEMGHEVLLKAQDHLTRWTDWHFRFRDPDGDGIPSYIMGNDSGWDNSTLFDVGSCVETPDLPAYLHLQMNTLQRIAIQLGEDALAEKWEIRSARLLDDLMRHSLRGTLFVAPISGSHEYEPDPTSLLACMPILLGQELPEEIRFALASRIETLFETPFGLATEALGSPKYKADGYWRGPIWAPTTMLAVDGLRRAGFQKISERIAGHFCDTVEAAGAYENFDALTGQGLCDMGYTWTSSAALCLMGNFLAGGSK